jgi:hypothetical protein
MTHATQKSTSTNLNKDSKRVLPEDSTSAVKIMTTMTKQLLEFMIEEGKVLQAKDFRTFSLVQHGKELLVKGYTAASTDFNKRVEEFRDVNPMEIDRLDTMTQELKKVAKANQQRMDALMQQNKSGNTGNNNLFLLQQAELNGEAQA